MTQESKPRNTIVDTIIVIILQGLTLVGITTSMLMVKESNRKMERMWGDYVPVVLLEGMVENSNYQIEEVVATIKGVDRAKIEEINNKYSDFQKTMLNILQKQRGGVTFTTRDAAPEPLNSDEVIKHMK